jgi:predicted regulator of Ras-like GTPase activity (Roadblock/LC7/MglB family)
MVSAVDAASALADLTEISSHVEAGAILDEDGRIVAATPEGPAAERLAATGRELLREADEALGKSSRRPTQLEAALREGSVFVVREGGRTVVARTSPRPPSALVLYDLATCLRAAAEQQKPKRSRTKAGA